MHICNPRISHELYVLKTRDDKAVFFDVIRVQLMTRSMFELSLSNLKGPIFEIHVEIGDL